MHSVAFFAVAAAALFNSALASPAATTTDLGILPGDNKACSTYTTVTSARPFVCDIVCLKPTVTCKPGEPTGPAEPTGTVTSGCTVEILTGGFCDCATCAAPTAKPTHRSHY